MEKECKVCRAMKPISEYYKHPKMADGHLGKCKECCRADALKNRRSNQERYDEYDRSRKNLPHRKELRKATVARIRKENPEKYHAHNVVAGALRRGKLIKQPCQVCGSEEVSAHHEDYSKPLEVVWLCHTHHMERHRKDV